MQISLISADRLPLSLLTELWNRGFADYPVRMQLTIERYDSLLRRELVSLPDSVVAMDRDLPIGFALAGLRWRAGLMEGYDAGTAVIPEYRGRGVASQLLTGLLERLTEIGVEQVALTALSTNQTAIALYRRHGFTESRRLTCWEQKGSGLWPRPQLPASLHFRSVRPEEVLPLAEQCYQQAPEWQNRPQGLKLQQSQAVVVSQHDLVVGYAVYSGQNPAYLYQLGVLPAWRRQGIGLAIWRWIRLQTDSSRCIYLNHPDEETAATAWLAVGGWRAFLQQVEMCRTLTSQWHPRLATPADLPKIERVLTAGGLPTGGLPENLQHFWLLLGPQGEVAGVVGGELAGEVGLLRSLWVSPEQRGQGLGRRLVEHQQRWLRSLGCSEVYLMANGGETFWLRLGYSPIRRERLPAPVLQFHEPRSACPLTAIAMYKLL